MASMRCRSSIAYNSSSRPHGSVLQRLFWAWGAYLVGFASLLGRRSTKRCGIDSSARAMPSRLPALEYASCTSTTCTGAMRKFAWWQSEAQSPSAPHISLRSLWLSMMRFTSAAPSGPRVSTKRPDRLVRMAHGALARSTCKVV
eukprot:926992-Prymnesium_polylepis.3